MDNSKTANIISEAWENRDLLKEHETKTAINETIELLDKGLIRVAEKSDIGWQVNEWIKKAVILYFSIKPPEDAKIFAFIFSES